MIVQTGSSWEKENVSFTSVMVLDWSSAPCHTVSFRHDMCPYKLATNCCSLINDVWLPTPSPRPTQQTIHPTKHHSVPGLQTGPCSISFVWSFHRLKNGTKGHWTLLGPPTCDQNCELGRSPRALLISSDPFNASRFWWSHYELGKHNMKFVGRFHKSSV